MLNERRIHGQDCYSGSGLLTEGGGVDDYAAEARGGLIPAGFTEGVRDYENPHS